MPEPRKAVVRMAPYSPPTSGRHGRLRLDFNENTVGCSPKVIEHLVSKLSAESLTVYPEYEATRAALSSYFGLPETQFLLTNGTDEAIQVLVNTYVDDGDEVLLLHPSYAMYKFYSEVAGAEVRELSYRMPSLAFPFEELLEAITPKTKAILLSNPNNPTGTAFGLDETRAILARAPQAAVLVDEAYFEFYGVTALPLIAEFSNLFVSRTFSKAFGMAALRIGCLFSQAENVKFCRKAQSPYSVNLLAAIAVQAAVADPGYVQEYARQGLAARALLMEGFRKRGIKYFESQGNFVLFRAGERSIEIRDALRERGVLVRDRSYEIEGCVRVTAGTPEQAERFLSALDETLDLGTPLRASPSPSPKPLLIFDMDGVLAEVTESYRAGIVVTVKHFTGRDIDNRMIQDYKNQGGWNNDWALSQKICADFGVQVEYSEIVRYFCDQFFGTEGRPGLIMREKWIPRDGLLERLSARWDLGIFTGRDRAELRPTLERFAPDVAFAPVLCAEDVAKPKPAPDGLLQIKQSHPERAIYYVGDTVDDARSAQSAGVPFIGISSPDGEKRAELNQLFQQTGAIAILDDVNQIEEILPA